MLEPNLKFKGSSLSTGLFHRDGSQKTWDLVLALPCARRPDPVLGRAWSSFSGKRRGWRRYAWGPAVFYGSRHLEWPCSLIHKQWRKQKSRWDCLVPKATALSLWVRIRPTASCWGPRVCRAVPVGTEQRLWVGWEPVGCPGKGGWSGEGLAWSARL